MKKIWLVILLYIASSLSAPIYVNAEELAKKDMAVKDDKQKIDITNNDAITQFAEILYIVDKFYVQDVKNKQEFVDSAVNGALSALDPHSSYITDDDLKDFYEHTKGEFGGIGVEVMYDSSAIKVISPIEDLPAQKVGINAGDYIVAVDGEQVSNIGFNKSIKKMRGEPNTKVKLLVVREGEIKPIEFELTREIVKIKPVKYSMDENIAYIRITQFNEHATKELKNAINTLKAKNSIDGIILDLRNNPGGLLDQAVGVSDYFINEGQIVSTKGRIKASNAEFNANPKSEKAPEIPIVVIINSGTASASEIVSGAIQDHRRGIVLGTKSFGKGSVQTVMNINNRAALKLTTAKYYTPSGKSIQAEGITPDIFVEQIKIDYSENNAQDSRLLQNKESSLRNYLQNEQKLKENKDNKDNASNEKKNVNNNDASTDKDSLQNKNDKNKTETTKDEGDKFVKNERKISDRYRTDYQYARSFDLVKGLILSNKINKDDKVK